MQTVRGLGWALSIVADSELMVLDMRGDDRSLSLATRSETSALLPRPFRPSPTRRSTTEDLIGRRRNTEALQPSNRRMGLRQQFATG